MSHKHNGHWFVDLRESPGKTSCDTVKHLEASSPVPSCLRLKHPVAMCNGLQVVPRGCSRNGTQGVADDACAAG